MTEFQRSGMHASPAFDIEVGAMENSFAFKQD